jgi:hypothetical protein
MRHFILMAVLTIFVMTGAKTALTLQAASVPQATVVAAR